MTGRTPRFSNDIVVIDLEASCAVAGANEVEESNIIELGAVRLDRRTLEIQSTFQVLVKPAHHPITPFITDITGITPAMVANAPTFDVAGAQFAQWYGPRNKSILAAFGVYYDFPLLRKEFRVFGLDYGATFVGGGLDIRSLAALWLASTGRNTSGLSIERTLAAMDIPSEEVSFHRALHDAQAAATIFKRCWEDLRGPAQPNP